MEELNLLTKSRYSHEYQPKTEKQQTKKIYKECRLDELSALTTLKYGSKPKVNIFPITVDFPLPTTFEGSETRINTAYNLEIPEVFSKKNRPSTLVGSILRIDHVLSNAAKYIDKDITVAGWANSARLQENDTLLFIELVDGTSPVPLQIVVKNTVSNFQELKKTKRSYSFRIFGKIIKSLGKGQ